jgi:hypothetical protein
MNTFDSWSPSIDWTRFAQGPVSDPMWHAFREVVRLCHCYEHWRQEAHEAEIKYLQGNIRYGLSISDSKDKMRDAAELADKKIAEMNHAATTEGNPDFILCTAVAVSVMGLGGSFARKRYRSLVLDTFDAAQLNNTSPMIISRRWQKNAGYSVQAD